MPGKPDNTKQLQTMAKRDFSEVIQEICESDPRYGSDCYTFVREGLNHTIKCLKRANASSASSCLKGQGKGQGHVSGLELLDGLRDYALREFGPMSKSVLNEWGIERCEDFGEIVFNLVKYGVLGKTDADSLSDFKGAFSFHEAFVKPFRPISPSPSLVPVHSTSVSSARPRKNKPAKKSSSGTTKN